MITKLRQKINKIDKDLLSLIKARIETVLKIKKEKNRNKIFVTDILREKELKNRWEKTAAQKKLKVSFVNKVFDLMIKESKRIQNESDN